MTDLFARLDEQDHREVRASAVRRKFARREVICHEGDPGDSLFVLESGRVAARVTTRMGDVATLSVMGAGDTFGELAILDPAARRTATIVALEPTVTLSFPASTIAELRATHPAFDAVIADVLVRMVHRLTALVQEALYIPADTRVARRLTELSELYADGSGQVEITLTQDDVASMAGTSRATVNRVLGELAGKGAVEVARGRIRILDPAVVVKAGR